MSALDLIKSPYFLTGLGATGVGGAGLIGWQALGGSGSETDTSVFPNLADLQINTNSRTPSFGKHGCFLSFFPNAHISHEDSSDEIDDSEESEIITKDGSELKVLPTSSSSKPTGNLVGCSLMKMPHNLKIPNWYLQAEITAKNDRVGWALWVSAFSQPSQDDNWEDGKITTFYQNLDYRLVLLEKGWSGNWVVKAGYSWQDRGIVGRKFNIHIEVPRQTNNEWINQQHSGDEDEITTKIENSSETTYSYSGIWEVSDNSSGNDIFEDIQIWGKDKSKAEILGNAGVFNVRDEDDYTNNLGYNSVEIGYNSSENKWAYYKAFDSEDDNRKVSFGLDIGEVLNKWYEPFKGRKGKWTELSEYCQNGSRKLNYDCTSTNAG